MKSIKNSFTIENERRRVWINWTKKQRTLCNWFRAQWRKPSILKGLRHKRILWFGHLIFPAPGSAVGVNMGPLPGVGSQGASLHICLFNLFEYVPYESNVLGGDGPGFMSLETWVERNSISDMINISYWNTSDGRELPSKTSHFTFDPNIISLYLLLIFSDI